MVSLIRDVVSNNKVGFRAVRYCTVGGIGALLQLGLTYLLTETFSVYYMCSLAVAILVATVWNFTAHGYFTYGVFRSLGRREKRDER